MIGNNCVMKQQRLKGPQTAARAVYYEAISTLKNEGPVDMAQIQVHHGSRGYYFSWELLDAERIHTRMITFSRRSSPFCPATAAEKI